MFVGCLSENQKLHAVKVSSCPQKGQVSKSEAPWYQQSLPAWEGPDLGSCPCAPAEWSCVGYFASLGCSFFICEIKIWINPKLPSNFKTILFHVKDYLAT